MKKTDSARRAFGITIAALTLLATVLRSLCFVLTFDRTVGYYDAGLLSTLLYIVLALVPTAALVYALLTRTAGTDVPPCLDPTKRTPLVRIVSIIAVGALAASVVFNGLTLILGGLRWLTLIQLLAAALSIPYFLALPSAAPVWSGISAVICCVLSIVTEYFDPYVTLNSPLKLMHLVAYLAIALYLLTELFAMAGTPKPRRIVPLAAVAAAFGFIGGTSHVIAALMGGIIPTDYLIRTLVLYAFGLYAAARLVSVICSTTSKDSETEEN